MTVRWEWQFFSRFQCRLQLTSSVMVLSSLIDLSEEPVDKTEVAAADPGAGGKGLVQGPDGKAGSAGEFLRFRASRPMLYPTSVPVL